MPRLSRSCAVVALTALVVAAAACSRDQAASTSAGATVSGSVTTAPATTAAPTSETAAAPTSAPSDPAATAAPTTRASAPAGPVTLGAVKLDLIDTARPTVSNGTTLLLQRQISTTVYVPMEGGPYPLVVFAHGFRLGPQDYDRIVRVIAGAGYAVAAPSFPLTDESKAGDHLDRGDLPNQAADVSFVIDSVTGTAGKGAGIADRIDTSRVAVVGHSDGADTALDTAYFPGRTDDRVKAVVAIAPDAMVAPGGSVGEKVPLLLIHGDKDTITGYGNAKTVFGQVKAKRFFITLTGADHLPPVQGGSRWTPVVDRAVVDFLARYLTGVVPSDDAIVRDGSIAGLSSLQRAP